MSTLFHNILRAAAGAMEIPVVICLLLLASSVFSLGWWLAELLGERRHMNASLPLLLETMRSGSSSRRASPAANLLEKQGEVYYDAKTGTYYIVPNAAGN